MRDAKYEYLRFEVEDNVAFVTFDSPSTDNSYRKEDEWELFDALDRIQTDESIHVAVVTGEGDRFGGSSRRTNDPFVANVYYERALRLFDAWSTVDTPIVIALNSTALLTLPLLSDIVIAERHVVFADTHVVGGVATATGAFLWPMSTGLMRARRYLLTGDPMSADEAERIGLVAEVVDTGASKARAREIAMRMAKLPPAGVKMTKRALNEWMRVSWGPIFKHALALEFLNFLSPEEYDKAVKRTHEEQRSSSG